MKPFFVLLIVFGLALISVKIITGSYNFSLAGCIAMSAMLIFTSIGHFAFSKGMAMMLPPFLPLKREMVLATGLLEIIAAITLLLPAWRHVTAIFLMLFFILLLPANIYAAIKKVDYKKGNYEGSGPDYLWFRVPLQLFFIGWVYWFAWY